MKIDIEGYFDVIKQTNNHQCQQCHAPMSPRRITYINQVKIDVLLECKGCGSALPLVVEK